MKTTTAKTYETANHARHMASSAIQHAHKTKNPAQSAMARIANAMKLAEEAEAIAETRAAKAYAAQAVQAVEEYKAATMAYYGI